MSRRDEMEKDFLSFWQQHFPEAQTLTREQALEITHDAAQGITSTKQDEEMIPYQDEVAPVYGAYEDVRFQLATFAQIIATVRFHQKDTLVSLGSGPASYELWLLAHHRINQLILVDHSPIMLQRALSIATALGLQNKVQIIPTDVSDNGLLPESADIVFCINALHWSQHWQRWITEAALLAKDHAETFITCSLSHPRSDIELSQLQQVFKQYNTLDFWHFLTPPELIPQNQIGFSLRVFLKGHRKNRLLSVIKSPDSDLDF